jgi:hypothetical protein
VLVAVPVDELALDHGKSNDAIIHARERPIHPRFIPVTLAATSICASCPYLSSYLMS